MLKLTAHELELVIGHAGNIMIDKAPTKFILHSLEGFQVEVEIKPVRPEGVTLEDVASYGIPGHCVWDHVSINGQPQGNRHGGKKEYVRLVTEFLTKRGEV